MGRGIAYQYDHHIIVDFYELTQQMDDDDTKPLDSEDYDQDRVDDDWEHFKQQVADAFGASNDIEIYKENEVYLYAETDRLYIGVDRSGADGSPCIFLEAKMWTTTRITREGGFTYYHDTEHEYKIDRDAERGFNRLIKSYGNLIEYWTTGYTAAAYGPKKDGSFVKYERKAKVTE